MLEEGLEFVFGDFMFCLYFLFFGEGFKFEFYVKLLKEEGYYFKLGEGLVMCILSIKEGWVVCECWFDKEWALVVEVIEVCFILVE